jgi:hypothetical protein
MTTMPHPNKVTAKRRKWTAIDGQPVYVTIEGEIVREQSSGPHKKLIYLQRIRFEKDDHIEYRFTY